MPTVLGEELTMMSTTQAEMSGSSQPAGLGAGIAPAASTCGIPSPSRLIVIDSTVGTSLPSNVWTELQTPATRFVYHTARPPPDQATWIVPSAPTASDAMLPTVAPGTSSETRVPDRSVRTARCGDEIIAAGRSTTMKTWPAASTAMSRGQPFSGV